MSYLTPQQIIETEVLKVEGRYSNNPDDAGGETMWGITAALARAHGYKGAMRLMPRQWALELYLSLFYYGPKFDLVHTFSGPLASECVEASVNINPPQVVRWLQEWLNVFNMGEKFYKDLTVDGWIGGQTIAALSAYLKQRKVEGEAVLVRAMNVSQGEYYKHRAIDRKQNETFVYGWILNRIAV